MVDRPTAPFDPLPEGPPDAPAAPDLDMLSPRRAGRLFVFMALGFAAALVLTFLLPQNRYVRYQQASDSIMFHVQWIYDRIHFDPTPIDVAIVGSSRLEASISPPILAEALSKQLSGPVHVANLSLVSPGRDLSYVVVKDLLKSHPEVKLIVLNHDGAMVNSHLMFKYVADWGDVVRAPIVVNTKYFVNVLFLPYRNIDYFFQSLFPDLFGVRTRFDASKYLGTDLDRTLGYVAPTGEKVNGDQNPPVAALDVSRRMVVDNYYSGMKLFGRLPADEAFPIDRSYARRIAALASQHGAKLAFVSFPLYGHDQLPDAQQFYSQFGPVFSFDDLSSHSDYYANGSHLNRRGAVVGTNELALVLAPLLKRPAGEEKAATAR